MNFRVAYAAGRLFFVLLGGYGFVKEEFMLCYSSTRSGANQARHDGDKHRGRSPPCRGRFQQGRTSDFISAPHHIPNFEQAAVQFCLPISQNVNSNTHFETGSDDNRPLIRKLQFQGGGHLDLS